MIYRHQIDTHIHQEQKRLMMRGFSFDLFDMPNKTPWANYDPYNGRSIIFDFPTALINQEVYSWKQGPKLSGFPVFDHAAVRLIVNEKDEQWVTGDSPVLFAYRVPIKVDERLFQGEDLGHVVPGNLVNCGPETFPDASDYHLSVKENVKGEEVVEDVHSQGEVCGILRDRFHLVSCQREIWLGRSAIVVWGWSIVWEKNVFLNHIGQCWRKNRNLAWGQFQNQLK